MSYIQFRQKCEECGKEWNAAFGIVGSTIVAEPPKECPRCKSEKIIKIADDWLYNK
jgi:DNA-directed RNA polymerase subunit RPC12/RpoP